MGKCDSSGAGRMLSDSAWNDHIDYRQGDLLQVNRVPSAGACEELCCSVTAEFQVKTTPSGYTWLDGEDTLAYSCFCKDWSRTYPVFMGTAHSSRCPDRRMLGEKVVTRGVDFEGGDIVHFPKSQSPGDCASTCCNVQAKFQITTAPDSYTWMWWDGCFCKDYSATSAVPKGEFTSGKCDSSGAGRMLSESAWNDHIDY